MSSLPRAKSGLVTHPIDNQVLVYSASEQAVHLLDPTTAAVLDLVQQGGWTREGAAAELRERLGVERSEDLVTLALSELKNVGLLMPAEQSPEIVVDRREMLRKVAGLGIAAFLIPTIATVTANPAFATSGGTGIACSACGSSTSCQGTCGTGGACSGGPNPNGFPTGSSNTITNPVGNCGGGGQATRQAAEDAACCDGSATETACSGGTVTFTC